MYVGRFYTPVKFDGVGEDEVSLPGRVLREGRLRSGGLLVAVGPTSSRGGHGVPPLSQTLQVSVRQQVQSHTLT